MEDSFKEETAGYALVPRSIVMDAELSPYAFRVYSILRVHDYGTGAGCYLARRKIAEAGHMCESLVIKSLDELRKKGYITTVQSTDGFSPSRHFCTDIAGVPHTPPTRFEAPTGVADTPHGCTTYQGGGVPHTPKVEDSEVKDVKYDSVSEPSSPVTSSCADAPGPLSEKKPRALRVTGADLLVEEMRTALGVKDGSEAAGKRWAAIFREKLSGCTAEERSRFLRWFLSDGYWTKGLLYQLSDKALRSQCDAWLMAGKTERKETPAARATGRPANLPPIPAGTPDMPPWIDEDLRVIDHEADRARDIFIARWHKHPAFMTPAELVAAGIPDYVRPPR